MNYFNVTMGSINRWENTENEFGTYESLINQLKYWVKNDSSRYAYIKFSNRLIDVVKWKEAFGNKEVIILHFNDVEEIAKDIREKNNG